MLERMREDVNAVFRRDPAARTRLEVLLTYPGLHALWCHRVANWFWVHKRRLVARLISHINRAFTGVEIHPGASFGRRVFIDHGMGIVVGETAVVGDDVLMYQGVVLGGTSMDRRRRHPTLEQGVVVGAGAIVLGPVTVGEHARIGAGSVVVKDVPPGATVVGVPARLAGRREDLDAVLDHGELPDPMVRALTRVFERESELEARLFHLEQTVSRLHALSEEEGVPWSPIQRREAALAQLRHVLDPEVGVSIVDLGLVQDVAIAGDLASVSLVLTTPSCPFADQIKEQVRRAVLGAPGVRQVEVTLLDEPWSWDRANAARVKAEMQLGEADRHTEFS